MSLTKAQERAVLHGLGNVLVSAGAGSGKTRVLTERVLRLVLEEGVPLDRLLILTFTNAAASSMKEKIRSALLKKNAFEQASLVDAAYIMTFDAFALALVKKYQLDLGLHPGVEIYEETLYTIEKKVTLRAMFDAWYAQPNEAFLSLLKTFVIASDDALIHFILHVDAKADLLPDKDAYFDSYEAIHFDKDWIEARLGSLRSWIEEEVRGLMTLTNGIRYEPERDPLLAQFQAILNQPTLDAMLTAIQAITFEKSKKNTLDEDEKATKELLKEKVKTFKTLADMVPIEEQQRAYEATRPYVVTLIHIIKELNRKLDHQKKTMNRYPFTDIAKMATSLLTTLGKKEECQNMFDYIMVDEYQDTNDLQEAFLQEISNHNLFMVGDVKQSIYRFRNANSEIFSKKLRTYTPYKYAQDGDDVLITMNQNFRSRREVLTSINQWFSSLMSYTYGGVEYTIDQALDFSQVLYDEFAHKHQAYDPDLIAYEKSATDANLDEPRIIAHDLLQKIKDKWQVFDHHTQSLRACRFEDFAILIDRKSNFEAYLEVFNEAGIPLDVFAERGLSDSDFFRVMRNLITVIVHLNEGHVEEAYAQAVISVLRSFLGRARDEDLYAYRKGQRSLMSFPIMEKIAYLASIRHHHTLRTWFAQLIHHLDLENALLRLPDVTANLGRLEGLRQRVGFLSDLGYTVERFQSFLKAADALDLELTIQAPKNTANAVRLMTIHKSKGLEFPVVYLPGLTKGFNMMDTKSMYQYSKRYGINLPYPDRVYQYPLFRELILNDEETAILSEQVRLWYVALTRAQEKLILITESSKERKDKELPDMRSFADFMHYVGRHGRTEQSHPRWVEVPHTFPVIEEGGGRRSQIPLSFRGVPQSFEEVTYDRASKALNPDVDTRILDYGSYLHECLALCDFKTMDVSFIPNEDDRERIQRLLALPYFVSLKEKVNQGTAHVAKEYAYRDDTGRLGVIDLLVIEGQEVTILDYKTSHLDDAAYDRQLLTYAKYVASLGYTVKTMYLISLMDARMREVQPQS